MILSGEGREQDAVEMLLFRLACWYLVRDPQKTTRYGWLKAFVVVVGGMCVIAMVRSEHSVCCAVHCVCGGGCAGGCVVAGRASMYYVICNHGVQIKV